MRITNAGLVGIGTNTPETNLHISNAAAEAGLRFTGQGGKWTFTTAQTSSNSFFLYPGTSYVAANGFRFDNNGSLAIGSTGSPNTSRLAVGAGTSTRAAVEIEPQVNFTGNNSGHIWHVATDNVLRFNKGTGNPVDFLFSASNTSSFQPATGNSTLAPVTFTTGSATQTSPVRGALNWDGDRLYIASGASPVNKMIAFTTDINPNAVPYTGATAAVDLNSQSLKTTGTIQIGSTAVPNGYVFASSGNMITRSIKVKDQNLGWPDYVFNHNYKLPTLAEVELYIKANKHLPGIPSAAEVAANGLDLGQMNAKLLQKIEEMTLLMIEQEKSLKQKEVELNRLSKRTDQLEEKLNLLLSQKGQ